MSGAPGLKLCIGADARPPPGFLQLDVHPRASTASRANDGLPFPDRAADVILCDATVMGLATEARLGLLFECRRVLRPQGIIRIAARRYGGEPPPSAIAEVAPSHAATARVAEAEVLRLARLVGLETTDCAPVAPHCRNAIAALPSEYERSTLFEYTKRDRCVVGDPLVSILIPSSRAQFFAACLDSALAQTYDNVEIVVCDDSPDVEIENMVRDRTRRRSVLYQRNPVRLGVRGNHRRCLESARGEFVKFLADDDLLAPTCVARLLDAFRQAPDVTLSTSHRRLIDAQGRHHPDQPATAPIVERDSLIAGHTLINAMLMAGLNVIGEPSTTLFRKGDLMDQAPDYFRFNGVEGHGVIDMVMWCALLLRGDAVYLRDSLSFFRIHPGQRQQDPAKTQRNIDSMRSLRSAWQALGLHETIADDQLLVKPFPQPAREGGTMPSAASPPMPPYVSPAWTVAVKPSP
jgi:glycosyltransferase involved in cell wall biosynthesis